ncbi:MAG: hypothetical protein JNK50_14530 [Bacteroidia bacterium]|nr:hypothetical protein [Bacteroidia bacterium]
MRLKNKYFSFFLFFILAIFSFCKKKEPEPMLKCTTEYDTWFSITQSYLVTNNMAIPNGRSPFIDLSKWSTCSKAPSCVNVNSIWVNGTKLFTYCNWYTLSYGDTLNQFQHPPFIWQINGTSDFPSFTKAIYDSIPQFYKYNLLPDTISKSGTTSIQLGGKNADEAIIFIKSNSTNAYFGIISADSSLYTVNTPTVLVANANATLSVTYRKYRDTTVNFKLMKFAVSANYSKVIYVKN